MFYVEDEKIADIPFQFHQHRKQIINQADLKSK